MWVAATVLGVAIVVAVVVMRSGGSTVSTTAKRANRTASASSGRAKNPTDGTSTSTTAGGPGAEPPKTTAGRLALGVAAVTSAAGPRVTVYGWQLTGGASPSGATAASEVKARSCRTVPGGVVLNLTFFALVLPDGTVLEATGGSEFGPVADDPDCLEGTLRFQVPNGIRPSYVRYRDGRSTYAWTVG